MNTPAQRGKTGKRADRKFFSALSFSIPPNRKSALRASAHDRAARRER
jgi:hypothetical protein